MDVSHDEATNENNRQTARKRNNNHKTHNVRTMTVEPRGGADQASERHFCGDSTKTEQQLIFSSKTMAWVGRS